MPRLPETVREKTRRARRRVAGLRVGGKAKSLLKRVLPRIVKDPVEAAEVAGLEYVSGDGPGITRRKSGKGFVFHDAHGKRITDEKTLHRIRSLVIPPAWTNVWICPLEHGHLQATGYDARGRKQYRYHPRFRAIRDENKYHRMMAFAAVLPKIRAAVDKDLALGGLPRRKVLAAVVRLLEITLIRVGNEEYARTNKSFGLTTMRDQHAEIRGSTVRFKFRGKSGIKHKVEFHDARLAKIVRQCQELPGQELFQYVGDDGARHTIGSQDVNGYIREIAGDDFTAKDFRTWAGTILAARALQEFERVDTRAALKKNVVRAIEQVAERLGNTRAVCKKCYVHPVVLDSYLDGSMLEVLADKTSEVLRADLEELSSEEAAVMVLLRARLLREQRMAG